MYEYHKLPMDMVVIQERHSTGFTLAEDEVYLTWEKAAAFLREMDAAACLEDSVRQNIMAEYFSRG
jgi:hypothetical protein